jgi:AraC-like DNA-binding protein
VTTTAIPSRPYETGATCHRLQQWAGCLALAPGLAIFKGQADNHQTHQHWVHQLALGLDGPVQIGSGDTVLRAPSIFVRAGAPHSLVKGALVSVFLDPTTELARGMCQQMDAAHVATDIAALSPALDARLRATLTGERPLDAAPHELHSLLAPQTVRTADARLQTVLAALAQPDVLDSAHSRGQLAALVGLSETRFSHWFREQTGMPLRSYRKWLRLVRGLEHALRGGNLTDAAHQAAFADQAHFSRTFLQMFGVRASDLVSSIHLHAEQNAPHRAGQTGASVFLQR